MTDASAQQPIDVSEEQRKQLIDMFTKVHTLTTHGTFHGSMAIQVLEVRAFAEANLAKLKEAEEKKQPELNLVKP